MCSSTVARIWSLPDYLVFLTYPIAELCIFHLLTLFFKYFLMNHSFLKLHNTNSSSGDWVSIECSEFTRYQRIPSTWSRNDSDKSCRKVVVVALHIVNRQTAVVTVASAAEFLEPVSTPTFILIPYSYFPISSCIGQCSILASRISLAMRPIVYNRLQLDLTTITFEGISCGYFTLLSCIFTTIFLLTTAALLHGYDTIATHNIFCSTAFLLPNHVLLVFCDLSQMSIALSKSLISVARLRKWRRSCNDCSLFPSLSRFIISFCRRNTNIAHTYFLLEISCIPCKRRSNVLKYPSPTTAYLSKCVLNFNQLPYSYSSQ